jgi:hypothetical protein
VPGCAGRLDPVRSLLSDCRSHEVVITVRSMRGHRPHLIARSYPHRVTLRLVNPDIDCHAEVFPVVNVRAMLPQPLGARELVHATTGKPVRYHVSQSSG